MHFIEKFRLMTEAGINRVLMRMASQIVENNPDLDNVILVGIRRRGVPLAARLATKILEMEGVTVTTGALDITLYRDDLSTVGDRPVVNRTELPGNITGKTIILVDDVLYTGRTVRAALDELMPQNPKAIILDLRNNGGGYLQTSVEVTSQFLGEGVVLYEQYGDGTRTTYDVLPGGQATDTSIPMIVLINEGSASASEIVAGALQDTGRAKLLGTVSYGKGSVQNWIPLSGDNGAVRVTIAKWLTPNENTIHEIGLTPDYPVELTEEDRQAEKDPQLDEAIKILLEMSNQ